MALDYAGVPTYDERGQALSPAARVAWLATNAAPLPATMTPDEYVGRFGVGHGAAGAGRIHGWLRCAPHAGSPPWPGGYLHWCLTANPAATAWRLVLSDYDDGLWEHTYPNEAEAREALALLATAPVERSDLAALGLW